MNDDSNPFLITQLRQNNSYFPVKNKHEYEKEKENLYEYLIKKEGKYVDFHKIESITLVKKAELEEKYNINNKKIEEKINYIQSLDLIIEKEMMENLIFFKIPSKNIFSHENHENEDKYKCSNKYNQYEILIQHAKEKLIFSDHALGKYNQIKERLISDKIEIDERIREEGRISQVNNIQYEKYLIIKNNSLIINKFKSNLLEDLKLIHTANQIKFQKDFDKRLKYFRELEEKHEDFNLKFHENQVNLIEIKSRIDLIKIKNEKYDGRNKFLNENLNKLNIEYRKLKTKYEKVLFMLDSSNIDDVISKIISKKTYLDSSFNYFKTLNEEIIQENKEHSEIVSTYNTLQKQLSQLNFIKTNLNMNQTEYEIQLNVYKNEILSVKELISQKEKLYLFLINYFKRYEQSIDSSFLYVYNHSHGKSIKNLSNIFNHQNYKSIIDIEGLIIYENKSSLLKLLYYISNFQFKVSFLINYSLTKNMKSNQDRLKDKIPIYILSKSNYSALESLFDKDLNSTRKSLEARRSNFLFEKLTIKDKSENNKDLPSEYKDLKRLLEDYIDVRNKNPKLKIVNKNKNNKVNSREVNNINSLKNKYNSNTYTTESLFANKIINKTNSTIKTAKTNNTISDIYNYDYNSEQFMNESNLKRYKTKYISEISKITNNFINFNENNKKNEKDYKKSYSILKNKQAQKKNPLKQKKLNDNGKIYNYYISYKENHENHDDSFLMSQNKDEIDRKKKDENGKLEKLRINNKKMLFERGNDIQNLNLNLIIRDNKLSQSMNMNFQKTMFNFRRNSVLKQLSNKEKNENERESKSNIKMNITKDKSYSLSKIEKKKEQKPKINENSQISFEKKVEMKVNKLKEQLLIDNCILNKYDFHADISEVSNKGTFSKSLNKIKKERLNKNNNYPIIYERISGMSYIK